ncbi:splicing factor PWI domain-containing protein [Iris pallida]|uniref:Splicing factor PWI domain-containing protein n=1 Tax=Iris pallida TaxID=29817 RepID=A0AAX6HMN9_IRIPA|nr:splicing factor PWI domain-containing protein [Iris pallida]
MAPSWRPSAPVRSAARQPLRRRVWSSGSGCPERYGGGPSARSRPGKRGHSAREERRNLRLRGGDGVFDGRSVGNAAGRRIRTGAQDWGRW